MAETANPTTPGPHNHVGGAAPRDTSNRQLRAVFGVDAPVIEGLPIEVGHGCKSVEWQLAEHVRRIFVANGRDAARQLLLRLLELSSKSDSIDQQRLAAELVERDLLSHKTAAAMRALDEFLPAGAAN